MTTRNVFAHAQNLSMDSFPKVSLETYKFKFAENIAQKQALKGGGMQLGHFFFTQKPAPLLTMALDGGSKANQRIPVFVARDIHKCTEKQRRDICLRLEIPVDTGETLNGLCRQLSKWLRHCTPRGPVHESHGRPHPRHLWAPPRRLPTARSATKYSSRSKKLKTIPRFPVQQMAGTQLRTQWRMGVQHPIAHSQHARWTIRESLKDKTSRDPCGVLTLRFLFFSFRISHRISLGGPRVLDQGADSMGRWSRILFHSLVHIR